MSGYLIGFLACAVATFCFGSCFLPAKKFQSGDGMFFQWVMCNGIWMVGFCVQMHQQSAFEPLACLGGMIWATGNCLCVPIISCLGMGMGQVIWGSVNLVTGWASGTFGFFGLDKQTVNTPALNFLGVGICILSMIAMFFVKPSTQDQSSDVVYHSLGHSPTGSAVNSPGRSADVKDGTILDNLDGSQRIVAGGVMSLVAGILFGLNFTPPQYLIDHHTEGGGHSTNGLDYVFSHFSGIYVTSTCLMLGYCLKERNFPSVYPQVIFPGFFSGVVWAIAQVAWFVANDKLSMVLSFPIISLGPSIVACAWSIFLFGEIQGTRNYTYLAVSFTLAAAGITCIVLSQV